MGQQEQLRCTPSSVHGSNVNLSPKSRWLVHLGYNRCDNHPTKINYDRKDVQANRDFTPLKVVRKSLCYLQKK